MKLVLDAIPSPIGTILVGATDRGVCALDFGDCRARMDSLLARRFGETRVVPRHDPFAARTALEAYLAGDLGELARVPLDLGGSAFEMRIWAALRRIPAGGTISYAELAAAIGRPGAARAAGSANGRNPVALFVPCHRVVRTGGALGGYAGGRDRKRWLLDHERHALDGAAAAVAAAGC